MVLFDLGEQTTMTLYLEVVLRLAHENLDTATSSNPVHSSSISGTGPDDDRRHTADAVKHNTPCQGNNRCSRSSIFEVSMQ